MEIKYLILSVLLIYIASTMLFFINIIVNKGKVYITKCSGNQEISVELQGVKRICICLFMSLIWPYLVIKNLFNRGY